MSGRRSAARAGGGAGSWAGCCCPWQPVMGFRDGGLPLHSLIADVEILVPLHRGHRGHGAEELEALEVLVLLAGLSCLWWRRSRWGLRGVGFACIVDSPFA